MKKITSKIGTGAIVFLILLIGLKGYFITVYSQNELQVYQDFSRTGEINTVYIVPSNYLIFKKQYDDQTEYGIFYIKASNATHYVGPFYSTGNSLLGLRIYSGAKAVWKAEMELIAKSGNLQESTFEYIGDTFHQLIIFRENSIELGSKEYQRIKLTDRDEKFANSVIEPLKRKTK